VLANTEEAQKIRCCQSAHGMMERIKRAGGSLLDRFFLVARTKDNVFRAGK
jgi:hypothetical protein